MVNNKQRGRASSDELLLDSPAADFAVEDAGGRCAIHWLLLVMLSMFLNGAASFEV